MNTHVVNHSSRRLPSIDWIALGLGVAGLMLSRIPGPGWGSWVGLLGLAVFGPPLLREIGVLEDEDEYTRNIRWRAGFHAALVVGLLVFLNKVLYPLIASHPEAMVRKAGFFPVDFLRQTLVLAFLLSFLIQYWGAPKGVFRLLLGLAGLTLAEAIMLMLRQPVDKMPIALAIMGIIVITVGGAFLSRKKPKLSGYLLLAVGLAFVVDMAHTYSLLLSRNDLDMRLGMIQSIVMMIFVFGTTGISLLKSDEQEKD